MGQHTMMPTLSLDYWLIVSKHDNTCHEDSLTQTLNNCAATPSGASLSACTTGKLGDAVQYAYIHSSGGESSMSCKTSLLEFATISPAKESIYFVSASRSPCPTLALLACTCTCPTLALLACTPPSPTLTLLACIPICPTSLHSRRPGPPWGMSNYPIASLCRARIHSSAALVHAGPTTRPLRPPRAPSGQTTRSAPGLSSRPTTARHLPWPFSATTTSTCQVSVSVPSRA